MGTPLDVEHLPAQRSSPDRRTVTVAGTGAALDALLLARACGWEVRSGRWGPDRTIELTLGRTAGRRS